MAIDSEKVRALEEASKNTYTTLRTWDIEDHEVVLMQYSGINILEQDFSVKTLLCECYFNHCEIKEHSIEHKRDHLKCTALEQARECIIEEARQERQWKKLELKEAVLDIFTQVKEGEYIGQYLSSTIYVQEVATFLEKKEAEIWNACHELFSEEKLDLNGAILCTYISRFRFPIEFQQLFRFMIEEPLGWPNGDAGDCVLFDVEGAIHENTDYKTGKDLFGDGGNYPNISPHILLMFSMRWLSSVLEQAQKDPTCNLDFDPETIALNLERLANDFRMLKRQKK